MQAMSRKRPKPKDGTDSTGETPPKKSGSYPSRKKTKYVGVSEAVYAALQEFAAQNSTDDDKKSVPWALRILLNPVLRQKGLLKPTKPAEEPKEPEE